MEDNKIDYSETNILVCCHKPCELPKEDYFLPVHVGAAISNYNLGIQRDDQCNGQACDNISSKNKNFCELTGLYWGWKNLTSPYKGLCHYRRFFDFKGQHPIEYLDGYDIVIASPVVLPNRASDQLMNLTTREDFYIMIMAIMKLYPEYKNSLFKYLFNSNRCSRLNMLFGRKEIYDGYCSWLFSIFNEMEKWIRISKYTRLSRLYGYLSEYLPFVYCKHNNLKIKYAEVLDCPPEKCKNNTNSHIIRINSFKTTLVKDLIFTLYSKLSKFPILEALGVGFKADGIPYIDEDGNIIEPK